MNTKLIAATLAFAFLAMATPANAAPEKDGSGCPVNDLEPFSPDPIRGTLQMAGLIQKEEDSNDQHSYVVAVPAGVRYVVVIHAVTLDGESPAIHTDDGDRDATAKEVEFFSYRENPSGQCLDETSLTSLPLDWVPAATLPVSASGVLDGQAIGGSETIYRLSVSFTVEAETDERGAYSITLVPEPLFTLGAVDDFCEANPPAGNPALCVL